MIVNAKAILLLMNNDALRIYDSDGFPYDVPIYGIQSKFRGIAYVPRFISKDVAKGENVKVHISNWFSFVFPFKLSIVCYLVSYILFVLNEESHFSGLPRYTFCHLLEFKWRVTLKVYNVS